MTMMHAIPAYYESCSSDPDEHETLCDKASLEKTTQDFLNEQGHNIHPVFDAMKSDAEEKPAQVVSPGLSAVVVRQAEDFLEMMDTHKTDYSSKLLDLRAKTSWDDMVKASEEAHAQYEAAGHHPVQRAARYFTAHADIIQPFLRLVPNDSYLSILYGGLRLVFQAFSNVHDKRVRVLKSFLRIPNIILLAESCVANFPSDGLLFERAEGVFCAALPAIEGTIRWLKQKSFMKPFRALALGSAYTASYKEKIKSLDDALNELQERVEVLRDKSIRKIEQTTDDVHHIVNRTDTQLFTVSEDLKNISKAQDEVNARVEGLNDLDQVKEEAHEAMKAVLAQTVMTSQWMKDTSRAMRRMKRQIEALERSQVNLTESDLLDILKVSENVASLDVRLIQRAFKSMGLEEIERASSIARGSRLIDWLSADASTALFIEGGAFGTVGRNTPLSFLCTDVIDSLRDQEPAVPIYFFCGSHTSAGDALRGPGGIMKSLLSQVVRLFPPKLDFISIRYRQQLESLHLYTLCDCFCKLVRGLPNTTILVCIIDGISFFETTEWASGCKEVMSHLQGLQEDDDLNPVFKLLVTSPVRSRYAGNTFPEACRLSLNNDTAANGRDRPTERELSLSSARPVRTDTNRKRYAQSLKRKKFFSSLSNKSFDTSQPESDSDTSVGRDDVMSGKASEMEAESTWEDRYSAKRQRTFEPDLTM